MAFNWDRELGMFEEGAVIWDIWYRFTRRSDQEGDMEFREDGMGYGTLVAVLVGEDSEDVSNPAPMILEADPECRGLGGIGFDLDTRRAI